MVLILALTGYLTPPAASIPWGTAYFCYALLFLAGHGPLAPPHLVSGSLSRVIRVEPLRFRIPHFIVLFCHGAEPLFWFGILHVVSIIALGMVLGSTLFLAITHTRKVNGERITPDGTGQSFAFN